MRMILNGKMCQASGLTPWGSWRWKQQVIFLTVAQFNWKMCNAGNITPLTLMKFYYTDGINFKPDAISGSLTIMEASDKAIRGTFNLYLNNNYNCALGRRIYGNFGVVNKNH